MLCSLYANSISTIHNMDKVYQTGTQSPERPHHNCISHSVMFRTLQFGELYVSQLDHSKSKKHLSNEFHNDILPQVLCMVYLPTFTIKINYINVGSTY